MSMLPFMGATATEESLPIARRRIRASVRATPDVGEGTFEALVSDYSQTYPIGWGWSERVIPGCFAESIAEHPTIPVCWNHDWKAGPIGHAVAQELDLGLIVRGEMYLDLDPMVQRVWRSMVARAVNEWSVAFFAERIVEDDAEPYTDLIERGDLIEATACFRGANPGTETLDLRGAPVVSIDGDAHTEVVRLRKLFSVPEIRFDQATTAAATLTINGQPAATATSTSTRGAGAAPDAPPAPGRERLVRARARLARLRDDMEMEPEGETDALELAEALDAVVDGILDALDAGDTDTADALATAADSTSDDLLDALGESEVAGGEPAEGAGVVASSALLGRLLATRAGRDAVRARVGSASAASPSTVNGTTP